MTPPPPTLDYRPPQPPAPLRPIAATAYGGAVTGTILFPVVASFFMRGDPEAVPFAFLFLVGIIFILLIPTAIFLLSLHILRSFAARPPAPSARARSFILAALFNPCFWIWIARTGDFDLLSLDGICYTSLFVLAAPLIGAILVTTSRPQPT